MTDVPLLPTINASLNAICATLLGLGYYFIRRKRPEAHRVCMLLAMVVATVFLGCYLYYHYQVGSRPFLGTGWIRIVYFTILISHTILATVIVPFVLIAVYRAFRKQFERHKRLTRWIWPVWMYVSITGVVIYGMLYHFPM